MPHRPQKKANSIRTPISGHKREGKTLLPPFAQFGWSHYSWMNDRLPEMVWAALIIAGLGRDISIKVFRKFLKWIHDHPSKSDLYDVRISGIGRLPEGLRSELLSALCEDEPVRACLTPLLLFDALPAKADWNKALSAAPRADVNLLMKAVGLVLFHQSQEATDCRWVRVTAEVVAGKFQLGDAEMYRKFLQYPDYGDQTEVRPMIRASEIGNPIADSQNSAWPDAFWKACWENTPCLTSSNQSATVLPTVGTTVNQVNTVTDALKAHWESTHTTTGIDAKHDTTFGIAFYSLRLLRELLTLGVSTTTMARLTLRTILEARITLAHLIKENKDELWKSWRVYGAGQAKLVSHKVEDLATKPEYISSQSISDIANEDVWEEMLSINLGHWSNADLRKIAIASGQKELYDSFYPWTSGFAHAQWGAVRESVFDTCMNPLHRLHRFPNPDKLLKDTLSDAARLVDQILDDLDACYPSFKLRVSHKP